MTFRAFQFSLCLAFGSLRFHLRLTFGIKRVDTLSFCFQSFSRFFQLGFSVIGAFPFSAYHNFVVTSFHSGNGEAQQYGLGQDLVVDVPRDGAGVA